ncbi:MAG: glucose-inhibited division protein A [Ghiorsea sp.]|nr:glucose-inhibited division protein A [Ghiorsea sp.]
MSEQQTLALLLPIKKHYGSWVRHPQVEEASGRLALWFVQGGLLWLTSEEEAAGKSHLLQALADENPHVALLACDKRNVSSVQQLKLWLEQCEHQAYWILDLPAGEIPTPFAYAVFHLIERAKEMNKALLISWRCAENKMPDELRSRLLMMAKVAMSAPVDDVDLKRVLDSVLRHMQWDMKETVLPTLLQHVPRTLGALLRALILLDAYSKAHKVRMNASLALRVLALHVLAEHD